MERILLQEEEAAAAAGRRRRAVVYLGDGRGDYCPSLKLREGDYVMPPAAAVRGWDGFEDLARVLLGIVDAEIARAVAEQGEVPAVVVPDCRELPLPARQEAALLPQAVRVPN